MPILLADNENNAVLGHLKWRGQSSIFFQNGSMKVLDEGEVKTKTKISIRTNHHYEGSVLSSLPVAWLILYLFLT